MKTKLVLISTITTFSLTNCQEKKVDRLINVKTTEKKMETSEIKNILIKQIKSGPGPEYWVDDELYTKKDLDALVSIEDTILKNNGYKTPEIDIFNQKIKTIFGRIIDNQSKNSYLKIYKNDKCDKGMDYQPFYTGLDYIYVVKNNNFITVFYSLPSVLDYQKIYPEVSKYEEKPYTINTADGDIEVSRWKDDKNLSQERRNNQQLLISRNKYLFNDDKSQLPWLLNNDQEFLISLVRDFGYDKDDKINQFVLEYVYTLYIEKRRDISVYEDLFFNKDCTGKMHIREGLLKTLSNNTSENNNDWLSALNQIGYYMYSNAYKDYEYRKQFTLEERKKIVAYILNTYAPLYHRYIVKHEGKATWDPSTILENLCAEDDKLKDYIISQKYYGLPNLKAELAITPCPWEPADPD
ncbi:hypothetical protein [Apibacter sp. HY039]|uniref:hypothetical protein n=1 Tax=Apibacter sp. HY039 TaxID=2501476 RepID=UPI000FEB6FEE|nr:hypothetical protein [Apibacter sp. HY039]